MQKEQTRLTFFIGPLPITGCGPEGKVAIEPWVNNIAGSGISRYDNNGSGDIYAPRTGSFPVMCRLASYFPVATTIDANEFKNQSILTAENGTIRFWMFVVVENTQHVEEADQIVVNSTLR